MFDHVKSHVIIKDEFSFSTGLDFLSIEAPHLNEDEDSLLTDVLFAEVAQPIYELSDYEKGIRRRRLGPFPKHLMGNGLKEPEVQVLRRLRRRSTKDNVDD